MKRFELKLQADRREELRHMAVQSGVSASDLARLAIDQLLERMRAKSMEVKHGVR
jgi:hypothetical protein